MLMASSKGSSRGVMAGVRVRLDTQRYTAELPTTETGSQKTLAFKLIRIF
jgi:hypothetical protein